MSTIVEVPFVDTAPRGKSDVEASLNSSTFTDPGSPASPPLMRSAEGQHGSDPMMELSSRGFEVHMDKLLGEGSYSAVYEALDVASGKIVAAKLTPLNRKTHKHCHDNEVHSFRKLGLGHPNIVRYYDDVAQDDVGVIILEKLTAHTLERHVEERGRLGMAEALEIFNQVVSAVAFMHEHHLSPRDLKPENIAYNPETHEVKVFDLGLAMPLKQNEDGSYAKVNVTTGSPLYMAPEVLAGKAHDSFAHDIWCLGQILYFMLVGHSPFHWCATLAELRDELIVFRKIKFPSWLDYNTNVLLKGMLSFDPAMRMDIKEVRETVLELLSYEREFKVKSGGNDA
jgi:serine/threonine protein kinase